MTLSLEKTVANGVATLEVSNPRTGYDSDPNLAGDGRGDAMLGVG